MCGIVGYVGNKQVVPLIIEGLRKLEYRGYDSAGIAAVDENHKLQIRRAEGKLRNLEDVLQRDPIDGSYGVGHTRWATHGRPTEENAHPHRDCTGREVVVHNGTIKTYLNPKNNPSAGTVGRREKTASSISCSRKFPSSRARCAKPSKAASRSTPAAYFLTK